jgi:hypothetical protein
MKQRKNPEHDLVQSIRRAYDHISSRLTELVGPTTLRASEREGPAGASCRVLQNGTEVSRFSMTCVPGCSAVVIFHGIEVNSVFRGKGLGSLLHEMRLLSAEYAGRQLALATTRVDNPPQNATMQKFNWAQAAKFKSELTGNQVYLWMRSIG